MMDTAPVKTALPRVCFAGVASGSPLGALLAASVTGIVSASSFGNRAGADRSWLRMVEGTHLRWWGSEQRAISSAPDCETTDTFVDFFGREPESLSGRFWRVVDGSGEAILRPFSLLERCCKAPYVESLFLIEATAGSAGWRVIAQAHISNCQWYRSLLDRAAYVTAHLVRSALGRRADSWAEPFRGTKSHRARSRINVAAALIGASARRTAMVLRETALNERWAIGAVTGSVEHLLHSQSLRPDRWIQSSSRSAYLADPFPLPQRSDVVLCERYDYRSACGSLAVITLTNEGAIKEEKPLALPTVGGKHLSYPCAFPEGGRLFLLPEMEANNELILFELLSETTAQAVCLVESGTRIADPTLFYHEGYYWVAYCDQGFGIHDNLCLLYARQLEGPWLRHRKNPVKIDVRSSRPGGTLFSVNGKLFRPAQDCSGSYGRAVVVNEVLACAPDDYDEKPVAVLTPDRHGPFPSGLHTLSVDGDRIFIDAKKLFFDPKRIWKRVRRVLCKS